MRTTISFLSMFFLSGLVAALAQDANMQSDSEEGTLLNVENTGSTNKTAVVVKSNTTEGTGISIEATQQGLVVSTNNASSSYGIGGISSYTTGTGYYVEGIYSGSYGGVDNKGLIGYGLAGNEMYSTGVYADALGYNDSYNYGIVATAGGYSGSTNYAGYFNGDVVVTGDCDPCSASDERLKTNIRGLEGGLSKVMALKPKSYDMKTEEYKNSINLSKGHKFGLLAQDVQAVLPELVHDVAIPPRTLTMEERKSLKTGGEKRQIVRKDPEKFKALNYTGLIPIMLKAIQEQQAEIEALKAQIQNK